MTLSTHDLTRRSTTYPIKLSHVGHLSTHDLTRRSTRSTAMQRSTVMPFNSRPHTEVDHCELFGFDNTEHFQLTTSHGGRRNRLHQMENVLSFNSRPHTEVDHCAHENQTGTNSFNSRPHTEVDEGAMRLLYNCFYFQLTTSHGGRRSDPSSFGQ